MKIFNTISIIILSVVIFIVGAYVGIRSVTPSASVNGISEGIVHIMIDSGNDSLKTVEVLLAGTSDLFTILQHAQKNGDLELVYTDYGGDMGVFLQGINGVGEDSSANKWWHYWVNGEYAMVGVSSQIVSPGDVVLFKYMPAQESASAE